MLLSIRGATVVQNTPKSILSGTTRLFERMVESNRLLDNMQRVSAVFVSMTQDLTAEYAAKALRAKGCQAIFSSVEPNISGSLEHCVRLLVQVNVDDDDTAPAHVYLGGAKLLRPDIATFNVAVDGPAGSGKSTLAKLLARRLGIKHVDTGAMYRAIAIKCVGEEFGDFFDSSAIESLLRSTDIQLQEHNGYNVVFLDGVDVSRQIRAPHIAEVASQISPNRQVRQFLLHLQRSMAQQYNCVMDGRDIGSVVLPEAEFKFFVTANIEVRARRRLRDDKGDVQKTIQDMVDRDNRDTQRKESPLIKSPDAILIDNTDLSVEDTLELIVQHMSRRLG